MLIAPATEVAAPGAAAPASNEVAAVPSTKKSHSHRRGLAEGALADILGYRVVQAQITTHALFMQHVGDPMDLRPVEYTLLQMLQANSQVTPKQLAQSLVLTAPKLTILLDRLQERGLITRVRSDTDGRSQHVLLTGEGAALARRGSEQAVLLEMELRDVLTPGERAILMELLQKVADARRG
ncbi:MarR family winged helix-turn-helix transcriptional regulator [Leptothrix discophora]|uniref:MarR family winged helix-turn-helix transcriptional regulator n=1 Tax=Leptothrix discophora TaxID=89 RepID=A0ABT9G6B2_LEPDI|nr:MarR family winged helix-turn-helix transcriptional regulator [Leptothrix discophora]MDP4302017.1 MarR family winged helix-turn-helix transcriptional regulator [Leptothrix discophora]